MRREDDLNNRHYYSTNVYDNFDEAKYRYTLSTRPQGVIKVPNLNYIPDADPLNYHQPWMNQPKVNTVNNTRVSIPTSYQEYQKRKVQELFGAPLETGE